MTKIVAFFFFSNIPYLGGIIDSRSVRELIIPTTRDTVRIHSAAMAGRPMGLIQSAWGGTRIEAWMSPKAIAATGHFAKDVPKRSHENDASALYNAMVSPWNKFAVRAALWYQGEYNAEEFATREDAFQTAYYSSMLASMVQDWREEKGMGDFAFVAMQVWVCTRVGSCQSELISDPVIQIAEEIVATNVLI